MPAALLIDISRLLGRAGQGRLPTGVDRVCLEYVRSWGGRACAVLQKGSWRRILGYADSQALFALLLAPKPGPRLGPQIGCLVAKACLPPWPPQDGLGRAALYLGHMGLERPGFSQWLRQTRQKPIFFVHDLIPLSHPEYCRAGEAALHLRRMQRVLQDGAGVVLNSQATLQALTQLAQAQGWRLPPTLVAPLAPALLPVGADTAPLEAPYFVVLGTIEPRKNHLLLLNVWRELVERLGPAAPHLVVIGQRGWECENVVDMLERCQALRGHVHEVAAGSDADVARYLRHARALLFPSFVEGYGMPLAEALQLGTPVVASDLPVFYEIAGARADYLSPLDGLGWAQAVQDYAAPDSPRRNAQLQRLPGLRLPTWEQHLAQVGPWLERLA